MNRATAYLVIAAVFAGCGRGQSAVSPSGPRQTSRPPIVPVDSGRLRVFQRADTVSGETSPAPHGGEMFVSVTQLTPRGTKHPEVSGHFFASGLEFALPAGGYELRTWFRAYDGRIAEDGLGLGPPLAQCVTLVDIRAGETLTITRLLHGWTRCEFVPEPTSWDLEISRTSGDDRSSDAWFVRLRAARATVPALEYELPSPVTAVFLVFDERQARNGDIVLDFGSTGAPGSLHACVLKSAACAHLPARGACELRVSSIERDGKLPPLVWVFGEQGGRTICPPPIEP